VGRGRGGHGRERYWRRNNGEGSCGRNDLSDAKPMLCERRTKKQTDDKDKLGPDKLDTLFEPFRVIYWDLGELGDGHRSGKPAKEFGP